MNVDDEGCILKLNARLFEKAGQQLVQLKKGAELVALVQRMHEDAWFAGRTVTVVMD